MTHYMNLNPAPFQMIKSGIKTIELRLNDEKRSKITIGDTIIFTNTDNHVETLSVKVQQIHKFNNFIELYNVLPLDQCGYLPHQLSDAKPEDMNIYYSPEKQLKYGVLGIEIVRL